MGWEETQGAPYGMEDDDLCATDVRGYPHCPNLGKHTGRMPKQIQAKDLKDEQVLNAIRHASWIDTLERFPSGKTMLMPAELGTVMRLLDRWPKKLILAKLRILRAKAILWHHGALPMDSVRIARDEQLEQLRRDAKVWVARMQSQHPKASKP